MFLFQTEYRLPFTDPPIAATLTAFNENVFSLLLLVGLASRVAALVLLGTTLVIEIVVYPDAWPVHGTWAVCLVLVIVRGAGAVSLDRLIASRRSKARTGFRRGAPVCRDMLGRTRRWASAGPPTTDRLSLRASRPGDARGEPIPGDLAVLPQPSCGGRTMRKLKLVGLAVWAAIVTSGVTGVAAQSANHALAPLPPKSMTLRAADGVDVHGTFYANPAPKGLILLFHQAGSSKGEYATIAPRLVAAGYSALAIDQRSGGGLFGRNQTAAGLGHAASSLDAKRDLEAALAWGEYQGGPVILWGSSYSAALVFLVAAERPQAVQAVLAFSPGEYLGRPTLVHDAAMRIQVPIFVTSAKDAEEIGTARDILAAAPAAIKVQYVPTQGGIHGSSTLIPSRDPRGAAENWREVLAFLSRLR